MEQRKPATVRIILSDDEPPRTDNMRLEDATRIMESDSPLRDEARVLYELRDCEDEEWVPLAWKWADSMEEARVVFFQAEAEMLERNGCQLTWLDIVRR